RRQRAQFLMILHTFNSLNAYRLHGHRPSDHDLILLIEDGVFLVGEPNLGRDHRIRVLSEDLDQRGLRAPSAITLISYQDWVRLTTESQHCVSWTG
ncbi:MAG: sulfur relay protein TusB/DsrH, partial [Candidatus Azotimanducaceae bacterium]